MSKYDEEKLKDKFYRAQANLIAAFNGLGRPIAKEDEIRVLQKLFIQARKECEHNGIHVESVWESAQEEIAENELIVRRYAEEQKKCSPILSYSRRQKLAVIVGLTVGVVILLKWPTLGGFLGAIIGSIVTFLLLRIVLADFFPTPAIRVGRKARSLYVNIQDLWPKDSEEFKDYILGFQLQSRREKPPMEVPKP